MFGLRRGQAEHTLQFVEEALLAIEQPPVRLTCAPRHFVGELALAGIGQRRGD